MRAAIHDDTRSFTSSLPAAQVAVTEVMRWTLPTSSDVWQQAYTCVGDTYEQWGVSTPVADRLGELAEEYVTEVLKATPSAYVAITAMIEGRRATVSVLSAHGPAPSQREQLPYRDGVMQPSWGRAELSIGLCMYATVNLINIWRGQR